MSTFDVILFDVGGVLLTNGWDHCERSVVLKDFQLDVTEFEARHPDANEAWEKDEITAQQYLDATVFYEPRNFTHQDFLSAIFAQSVPLEDSAIPVLHDLSATQNYLIGSLNNEAREPNDYRFARYDLRKYFEIAFSSCYVGLRKPHPEIYKRTIDILGRPAERILFIDDRQGNVDAAVNTGLKGIRFIGEQDLRRQLKELTVF
jgi:putative hydrolase of the HAD superfamily